MTDNEIIKALEYCKDCSANLNVEIIDLITRQQREIENLKVENQSLRSAANSLKMHYEEAQAEIERLKHCEFDVALKAREDFAAKIIVEIESAIQSNIDAVKERIEKGHRDVGFESRCAGKIVAMQGIRDFIEEEDEGK